MAELLPRTGFRTLDEAVGRKRQAIGGVPRLDDPTQQNTCSRLRLFHDENSLDDNPDYVRLNRAYLVDSYVRQGVNKYVELCTKAGWRLDCKTPEPRTYLEQRFLLMGLMTGTPFEILVDDLVKDYIHYANAFWIKSRGFLKSPVPGIPQVGALGSRAPVLGYFRADPSKMRPVWSKDNAKIVAWNFHPNSGDPIPFDVHDVVHFRHHVPAGAVWGSSDLNPSLEDVAKYRQVEEYMIRLLYKHLNPLIHYEVADNTGYGLGRQEDVDQGAATMGVIAPDGMIVTPPGHKIQMIGAESHALRAEGYMRMLRERGYGGLGLNSNVMGEGDSSSAGSADAMTITMHNRAKFYQRQLGLMLTVWVLYELLLEGGYNPIEPLDQTQWSWNDIETEARIKMENHIINEWNSGLLSESEARHKLGRGPLEGKERKETQVYKVKIPAVLAQADAMAKARLATAGPAPPARDVGNRDSPKNQRQPQGRGAPKVRPK